MLVNDPIPIAQVKKLSISGLPKYALSAILKPTNAKNPPKFQAASTISKSKVIA
jgi:hypothetical protein